MSWWIKNIQWSIDNSHKSNIKNLDIFTYSLNKRQLTNNTIKKEVDKKKDEGNK